MKWIENYWFRKPSLGKKWSFPLRTSSVNVTKSTVSCGFVKFTEETLNEKLHFLYSAWLLTSNVRCIYMCKYQLISMLKLANNESSVRSFLMTNLCFWINNYFFIFRSNVIENSIFCTWNFASFNTHYTQH